MTGSPKCTRSFASASSDEAAFEIHNPGILFMPTSIENQGDRYSVLFTCEHASNKFLAPFQWHPEDRARLENTHWAYDPGAAELTREMCDMMNCAGVLAAFSRLIIDANRPLSSIHEEGQSICRTMADGLPVLMNQNLSVEEFERRAELLHKQYHHAVDTIVGHISPRLIVNMHSFTADYEGQKRDVEIGVVCNQETRFPAELMADSLRKQGYDARINEPWSGEDGFMHAALSHKIQGGSAVMLEFRNDLLTDPDWRSGVKDALFNTFLVEELHRFVTNRGEREGGEGHGS